MTSGSTTAPSFRHTIIPGAGNRLRVVITVDPPVPRAAPEPASSSRRPRPGPGARQPACRPPRGTGYSTARRPRPSPTARHGGGVDAGGGESSGVAVASAPPSRSQDRAPSLFLLAAPSAQPRTHDVERSHLLRRRWLVASVLLVMGIGVGMPLLFQAFDALLRH